MDRRVFLGMCGAGSLVALAGCRVSFESGLKNPCLAEAMPTALADHELVRAAWEGIDPGQWWDCHAHIAGIGDGGTGVWITPQMSRSLRHPWQSMQRRFYLNASCAERAGHVDQDFVARLLANLEVLPQGAKSMLLAFDYNHDESGARREDLSAFHVPNRYAAELARRYPQRFEWICSVHPYRADAIDELERCTAEGARAVKWLPSAMGMDPASKRCDAFFDALARLRLPLLSHGGAEHAVHGGAMGEFNNPLRLRRPLDRGVRVIVAHCASHGQNIDSDRGAQGPTVEAFALFARLMDEPRYRTQLYADISAVTQANRPIEAVETLLARTDWHERLVHGSDYPLPGVIPLFSLKRFVRRGWLAAEQAQVLEALRPYNALLFDFVLKRSLRRGTQGFAPAVFESRRLFDASPVTGGGA